MIHRVLCAVLSVTVLTLSAPEHALASSPGPLLARAPRLEYVGHGIDQYQLDPDSAMCIRRLEKSFKGRSRFGGSGTSRGVVSRLRALRYLLGGNERAARARLAQLYRELDAELSRMDSSLRATE